MTETNGRINKVDDVTKLHFVTLKVTLMRLQMPEVRSRHAGETAFASARSCFVTHSDDLVAKKR